MRFSSAHDFKQSFWNLRGRAAATIASRLSLRDVSCQFGDVLALDHLSLEAEPGEILCLLGHSGSGKTTLLRIAAGLVRPDQGSVLIDNVEICGAEGSMPAEKRGIGLMFQDFALFPHMSVLENVLFGLRSLKKDQAKLEAMSALRRVGLETYVHSYPSELSGGEQQRVALARAIAPRPGILLMDEPFSGLDARLRDQIRDETFAILKEARVTTVMVTHSSEEAMRMADKIVLMQRGKVLQEGAAHTLYQKPNSLYVAQFFSELNLLEGVVARGCVTTPLGTFKLSDFDCESFHEGTEVDIGVRYSGIQIGAAGCGAAGRVVHKRFLGDVDLLEIAVQGHVGPVFARVSDTHLYQVKDNIGIEVRLSDVFIFKKP